MTPEDRTTQIRYPNPQTIEFYHPREDFTKGSISHRLHDGYTDSGISHCSKKVTIFAGDVAAPGNLADHASSPKIQGLADPKNGLANVATVAGRLDLPPLHATPKCYSAAVPGRMFLEFLLRPLGVNRVDTNFHKVIQGLAGCAFAKEEDKFIVTVKRRTVFLEKRLEQRSPDLQV